jgi:molybdenum cofactor cytidylyltransferase
VSDPPTPSPITGVVPAAGLSSRIGSPKPLLDAGGESFLDRVITTLRTGGVARVVVGLREAAGPVHAAALRTGAEIVIPADVDAGPIATIRAALSLPSHPAVAALIVLPVDTPLVSDRTVRLLVERFERTGAPIVLPEHRGETGHPVIFAGDALAALLDPTLKDGARTVSREFRDRAEIVEVDDRGVLIDIDTLPDYRRHFPAAYRKRFQKW